MAEAVAIAGDKITLLIKLLGMLGSDQAGERDNAARKVHELVRAAGMTWEELLRPKQSQAVVAVPAGPRIWVHFIEDVLEKHYGALRQGAKSNEVEFLVSMMERGLAPTEKQEKWLRDIAARTGVPLWDGA
jgi:hypothetical protein